jgi:hypothetical protein
MAVDYRPGKYDLSSLFALIAGGLPAEIVWISRAMIPVGSAGTIV